MARKRRQGAAEDIMDLLAMLPWWAGVALAVVSYVFFSVLARRPVPAVSVTQVGAVVPAMMIQAVSGILQYLFPVLCILGAVGSAARRSKRESLVRSATGSEGAAFLDGMRWQEFEQLVGEAFRLQGFGVREQGGARPDGGIDLVLTRGKETFLVQCKHWRAFKVGVDVVRELYGLMAARGAAGGFVVTSGQFTDDAVAFAQGRNVQLVDGGKLTGLLERAKQSLSGAAPRDPWLDSRPQASSVQAPPCPACGSSMVARVAKKGPTAGTRFWGCSRYPTCRATRA